MSLINDMLRNLEAKRPDDLARQNLPREIRSLPAAAPNRPLLPRLVLFSLLPLLGAGAAVLHLNGALLPLLGMTEPPAVVAAPVPAPVAVSAPAPAEAATPAPVAEEAQPAGEHPPLRTADQAVASGPAAPVLAVPDPVALPVPAKAEAEAAKVAPAVPAGPVKIEKSPVLATPRDRADAEYRKAEAASSAGRSGEALDALRAALKHDPSYVQVRQALLRQLLDLRKFDEAMGILQEGLETQPGQIGWAMSLARLQLEQGDAAAADRTLARSQSYAESSPDYAGFQGHLKSRQGAHRQAAAHYQRATRLAPGEGRWWLGYGLALEADGKAGEAREALKRALASGNLSAELSTVAEQHLR
jgi:MSHA biogenesis protein MshN